MRVIEKKREGFPDLVHDDGDVAGVLFEPVAQHVALVVCVVQRRDVGGEILHVHHLRDRIFSALMLSDRKYKAFREGSK